LIVSHAYPLINYYYVSRETYILILFEWIQYIILINL